MPHLSILSFMRMKRGAGISTVCFLDGYSYLPDRDPGGFIRTGSSIPPRGFLIRMGFFILDPWGFYSDQGFFKLMDDAFIWAEVFWK